MDAFKHSFVFSPGTWKGEGKIMLSMVEEELFFNTSWSVFGQDFTGKVICAQDILIHGLSENMRNEMSFSNFENKTFTVEMENQNVGKIIGTGVYDDKLIGWEFRNNEMNFEGFETYHLQEDGSYLMKGEYITTDQFRTQIEARLWSHSKEIPFREEEEPGDSSEGEDS